MKYCSTFRPSRKFAVIGVSMIEPSGFAIRPRMPASWRIWAALPRAPESAIMKIELNEPCCTFLPLRSVPSSWRSWSIIALPIWSFVRDQMSTTLL